MRGRRKLEFEFKCPICKKNFPNPGELRDHRLKAHSILNEVRYKA